MFKDVLTQLFALAGTLPEYSASPDRVTVRSGSYRLTIDGTRGAALRAIERLSTCKPYRTRVPKARGGVGVVCRGGPWAGQKVVLPKDGTLPFRVGRWYGQYTAGVWRDY